MDATIVLMGQTINHIIAWLTDTCQQNGYDT